MVEQIQAETIPIDKRALVPLSLRFESEPGSNGRKLVYKPVRNGDSRRSYFRLASWQRTIWVLFLYLVMAAAPASAQYESAVPTVETILARMAQARAENRARFRPYVVTRNYKVFGKEQSKIKSQVIAEVTFVPPNLKNYVIEKSSGAGLGERAVRRILQSEAEAAKDYGATDYSPANYDFRYIRDEQDVSGQQSYVLELLPKRQEQNLIRGKIWVDASTYRIHRVEGEPAKPSSWWVRDVEMVLLYSDVDGMWLHTGTEATARVRLLGPHRMISNDVDYAISQLAATASSKQDEKDRAAQEDARVVNKPTFQF
ncbi:MAG: hypothetical protein HY316_02335 [Acidobacteria bacterium]|nr:hypothetical protein [Acidobacteriota bacterium]